jgi:hypothetical protein
MSIFRVLLACVIFCFSYATLLFCQDTAGVGAIYGTVVDAKDQPVNGATVSLTGTGKSAITDAKGTFRISEVRTGVYEIDISAPPRVSLKKSGIEVRAGLEGRVEVVLPDLETKQEVTVTESVFIAPEEVKNSSYLIQPREILKTAGSLQDVSRYLQTLPGVVIGSNDLRNDIIVRGGSPLENLFIVDNIEIPNINAFANFASAGGTVSILDAELINDVNFFTGGYPAPYINRLSGVLQIANREGSREKFNGRATLGFAGAGTIVEGPIGKEQKGSWIVSARRSFLDLFTDDVGFGGVPIVYTFNSKALYDLTPRDRIWFANLAGIDEIAIRGDRVENPSDGPDSGTLNIFSSGWRSASGLNWQRLYGSKGVGLLGLTHSEAKVGAEVFDLVRGLRPGTNGFNQPGGINIFRDNSREGETTLKYDLTSYVPFFDKIQAGGSFKIFRINYQTASPFGTDSPFLLQRDANPFDIRQKYNAYQSSGYFQSSKNVSARLNLTWGGRFDNYSIIDATRFSPRAGVSYRINDKLTFRSSWGIYFQQPFFLFVSAFPQNRGLIPSRSDHYVSGISYIFNDTLRMTVEGYWKAYKDYPVALQIPSFSLANAGDTFAVRNILFPFTSAGRGRVRGLEFFLEKKFTNKWYGQTNFAVSQTRHAGLDGVLRPGTFDYPFVFNVVGGYKINKKWETSLRVAYLTGRPFTPYDQALSRQQGRGVFDLGRLNGERAPDYFRADFRVDRNLTWFGNFLFRTAEFDRTPQLRTTRLGPPSKSTGHWRTVGPLPLGRLGLEILRSIGY